MVSSGTYIQLYMYMKYNYSHKSKSICASACMFVCNCLATKVFIGKLMATGVIVGWLDDGRGSWANKSVTRVHPNVM